MPRPKLTPVAAELSGATKRNPGRYKGLGITSGEPVGGPSKYLEDLQIENWNEMVSICPKNVLTETDRWYMEMAVNLMTEFRSDMAAFRPPQYGQLRGCLSALGMSPVDRAKLRVPEEKPSDKDGFGTL